MAKLRVYELAKRLNVNSKDILTELQKLGVEVKSHSSGIEDKVAQRIAKLFLEKEKAEKAAKAKKEEKPSLPEPAVEIKTPEPIEEAVPETAAEQAAETKPAAFAKEGATAAEEEDLTLPDRFKKDVESEKFTKFKGKPGLQKAFDTIKRIDVKKKWPEVGGTHKIHGKRPFEHKTDTKELPLATQPRKRVIKFQEGTTLREFAELIGQKVPELIKKFMELGYMPTINQPVDADAAQIIAEAFGMKIELTHVESEEVFLKEDVDISKLKPRPPIVTIMGHVDHGKTTLLDAIRQTRVTETEAGGITQHIGAYKVRLKDKEIAFLDTPGHEAFTMMRARGAKVTDIVVLVVAADDGVMPQTIEAIDHAKAANVPIVVAVNKIDKPEANIQRVRNELAEHGIVSEEWGGQNIFVEVSAKQKQGIGKLLEMILLQSEMMELKADYQKHAKATIIEAKLDKGRGPVATVMVNSGTLKVGDAFIAGTFAGKVRALIDDTGHRVQEAPPSTPVEVIGFSDVPNAGDIFAVVEDERRARQIALTRFEKHRASQIAATKKLTLDELYGKIKEGEVKELNIIIKADVQGSAEAVKDALEGLSHPQVKIRVIHTGVGGINESDVMLASASNAIIIGFNTRPDLKASTIAEREGIDIRRYNIIYEAIEDVKKALEGLLEPTVREKILGRAEVRQLFHISRLGTIAGCHVVDGTITRASSGMRVIRDNIIIYDSKIGALKRFKDDVKEVQSGYECGILVENFNDLKVGDILENYLIEKVAAKLS
ncbi:MAG: translation initiation factor IF-2 [Nitrospirae bacterium]|nr:translation initiation factor IF-2 [Nitrospirota bacterium]